MCRADVLLLLSIVISQSSASPFPDDFAADRALCSYFGCSIGREAGMAKPEEENQVLKRPFCNGFRGCANGKRSLAVSTKTISQPAPESDDILEAAKRPFCNGFRGCANGKRSNVLDRDQLWFLQKLLENISRPERRSSVNSDASLRRKKRSLNQVLTSLQRQS